MKKIFNKIICFLGGHVWEAKKYKILLVNSKITLQCKTCHEVESYYGDGSNWRSLKTRKEPSNHIKILLAEEQAYQHSISLKSNIYNDHCS